MQARGSPATTRRKSAATIATTTPGWQQGCLLTMNRKTPIHAEPGQWPLYALNQRKTFLGQYRNTSRITNPHCTARSEYQRGAPRWPLRSVSYHRPLCASSNHTVSDPRSTNAASYARQFRIRYLCLCSLMLLDMGSAPIYATMPRKTITTSKQDVPTSFFEVCSADPCTVAPLSSRPPPSLAPGVPAADNRRTLF